MSLEICITIFKKDADMVVVECESKKSDGGMIILVVKLNLF